MPEPTVNNQGVADASTPNKITIQSGQTLSGLAQEHNTNIDELLKLNPQVTNPDRIFAGAELNIPGITPTPAVAPTPNQSGVASSDDVVNEELQASQDQAKQDAESEAELRRAKIQAEINALKGAVTPEGGAPVAPSLAEDFRRLVEENDPAGHSVTSLQGDIVELNKEKEDLMAQYRKFKSVTPEGVEAGFAAGAISEEAQAVQDQIDFINRQINTASLQLQNRSNVISMLMDFKKFDFTTASDQYDRELQTNLSLYSAIDAKESRIADNAKASLQVIMGEIKDGGLVYDELGSDKKAMIANLEIQANMPKGLISLVSGPDKDPVAFVGRTDPSGNAYTDVLFKEPDGSIRVESFFRGQEKVSSSESSIFTPAEIREANRLGLGTMFSDENFIGKLMTTLSPQEIELFKADYQAEINKNSTSNKFTFNPSTGALTIQDEIPASDKVNPDAFLTKWIKDKKEGDDALTDFTNGNISL